MFEVFTKKRFRSGEPVVTLTPQGRIRLSAYAYNLLRDTDCRSVLLLWDKSLKQVAIQGISRSQQNSYAMSPILSGALIGAHSFFRHIGWSCVVPVAFSPKWDKSKKMLEIALEKPKCQRSTR